MKKIFISIGILLFSLAILSYMQRGSLRDLLYRFNQPELPEETPLQSTQVDTVPQNLKPKEISVAPKISKKISVNLAVPFTSQAPHSNWDYPYQEACEEASAIMVDAYFRGKKLDADTADSAILSLIEWENKIFGYYRDTTAAETARILREYFGFTDVQLLSITGENHFKEIIEANLSTGKLIIIPAAGRKLNNPFFTPPGPPYHMLVIKGYTKDGLIITNDPGTRRGHNYTYSLKTLYDAVHDWNGGAVEIGAKVIIIVNEK